MKRHVLELIAAGLFMGGSVVSTVITVVVPAVQSAF
jgi:hypothetical protein